ncbi:hypothetical protein ACOBQB_21305 [Streptomyces sp. G5(2025)]|uniref:hypothetical protein n=1 Tax=Streptomyces sp. G5(2025) TaxID=3406628 RepID=UPI003C18EBAD
MPRLAAALSGLALILGGAVIAAPAAHATPQACFYYVLEQHPETNPEVVERGCVIGAQGDVRACYTELRRDYVPAQIAYEGCRRASQ